MKKIEKIFDAITGEENIFEIEMTDDEITAFEEMKKQSKKITDAANKAAEAKSALLEKLGITAEEAKLLLS